MLIVGHRGAAGSAPENTLASFERAIELGCDRTELDVRLSRDGVVVVIHDPTLHSHPVEEMTWEEIHKEDLQIAPLKDVVDICKNKIALQIELKAEHTPELVVELIRKKHLEKKVVITSFDAQLLKACAKLEPTLPLGLLFHEIPDNLWGLALSIPLVRICPDQAIVTKKLVDTAHKHNLLVYAFHVKNKERGDELETMGVDEIGTDFPELFLKTKTDHP